VAEEGVHNTWETTVSLNEVEGVKGLRKLKNYTEAPKRASAWLAIASIEDKEEYFVAREKDRINCGTARE
jgi:hypothetical protein